MAEFIGVRNFERFQHYRDRKPVWIKLYNDLLDDYDFCALPDASKWLAVGLWLLASRNDNRIRNDPIWLARMVHATDPINLRPLLSAGFVFLWDDASDPLAKPEQVASPEVEAEARKRFEKKATIIALHASGRSDREEQIDLIIRAANRGMRENPAIGSAANPIVEGHASRRDVLDWLDQGVPFELAESVVFERARTYPTSATRRQPHTMRYFTGAVLEAYDKKSEVSHGRARISRDGRAGENAGRGAATQRGRLARFAEDGDAA